MQTKTYNPDSQPDSQTARPKRLCPILFLGLLLLPSPAWPRAQAHVKQATQQKMETKDFTRMARILFPLKEKGKIRIDCDPLKHEVRLFLPRLSKKALASIEKQVASTGGRILSKTNEKKRSDLRLFFPFRNLRVNWGLRSKPRRLFLDIGTGRYLLPTRPWPRFAPHFDGGSTAVKKLARAEDLLDKGKMQAAQLLLEKLHETGGKNSILACIHLPVLYSAQSQHKASRKLSLDCIRHAQRLNSPLRSLFAIHLIAYGGELHGPGNRKLFRGLGASDSPAWLLAPSLYDLGRIRHARAEYPEAMEAFEGFLTADPTSPLAMDARAMGLDSASSEADRLLAKAGHASAVRVILDGLRLFNPLDPKESDRLSLKLARSAMKAGAPKLASQVLLWRLKDGSGRSPNFQVLEELVAAFLDSNDLQRAEKTLLFYKAVHPNKTRAPRFFFLQAKIFEIRDSKQEAVKSYQKAAKAQPGTAISGFAAHRAALILREQGHPEQAMLWLTQSAPALSRIDISPQLRSDLLMLHGDLAYEAEDPKLARKLYESFLKSFPKDKRADAVGFRLQMLNAPPSSVDLSSFDSDFWTQASNVLSQSKAHR